MKINYIYYWNLITGDFKFVDIKLKIFNQSNKDLMRKMCQIVNEH